MTTDPNDVVIVGLARTPLGRFGGALSTLAATELGAHAVRGALSSVDLPGGSVDHVVLGHVLQAGQGQITARQAAVAGGVPLTVPAETINKVCLSGMTAIARGRDLIRLGEAAVVVAGGMESMSRAPYVLDGARFGYRMGDGSLTDVLLHDGLSCAFDGCSMGEATEGYQLANRLRIDRTAQDDWAARSHARAAAAWRDGAFDDEVVPVEVTSRRGPSTLVLRDEGIREDTTVDSLAALRPAFTQDGTITAGNASQVSDGAAAVVLASRSFAAEHGLEPLATILAWGSVAGPDPSLHHQPSNAIRAAAARASMDPASFDLYEINEAFASVAIAATRDLGIGEERVNVAGGAVALGHPIGCSGARIVVSLVGALRRRGGGTGAAALCGGGGQGDALLVAVGR